MRSIKVLVYTRAMLDRPGGVWRWLREISSRIIEKYGYDFVIFAPKAPIDSTEWSTNGVKFQQSRNINLIGYAFIPLNMFSLVRSLLKCNVIVIDMNIALHDLIGLIISKVTRKPIIFIFHCPLFLPRDRYHNLYTKLVTIRLLNHASAIWVMNPEEELYLKTLGIQNIQNIPLGVDTAKFHPIQSKQHDIFVVTFVGRVTWQKGIDLIISAIDLIIGSSSSTNKIRFNIVGYGDKQYIRMIHDLIRKYDTDNISYLGSVTDEKLQQLLSNSDLFIFPSRYETFGIPALEAQASGVPVVTTNIQGLREIIRDQETDYLFSQTQPLNWLMEYWNSTITGIQMSTYIENSANDLVRIP